MTETQIQHAILDWLLWNQIFAWRNQRIPTPIRRGRQIIGLRKADPATVGMPDILCCIKGRLIGLEVKTDTGKQSKEQVEWGERLEKAGGVYAVVRSVDDVESVIKSL